MAFHSVWWLLKSDTFYRFRKTKQYTMLCNEIKEIKEIKNIQKVMTTIFKIFENIMNG